MYNYSYVLVFMSVCRSGYGVGVVNGCLYVLGGYDGVLYRNKVEYFNF